ncbi:MAG: PAS domain-containing protein, partial [Bacteroidota bacterium]
MSKGNLFRRKHPAGWITTIYIFFGALWILFSDNLVAFWLDDPGSITQIQTYKGWFFVLASGILIYSIVSPVLKNLEKAQTNIKEKEIMQKDLLNRHYQPLWQTDELGHCIFSNEKWMELTGIHLPSHKPFSWISAAHPDDKTGCIQKFTTGFLNKEAFSFSYRVITKDKKYRWFVNSCFPYHNAQNEFMGMICLLFDINGSKQLEIEYKQNFIWYKNLFSIHPSPMLIYNTHNLNILDVNESALQKYGYTRKEFLKLTFYDLLVTNSNDQNPENHLYDQSYEFEKESNKMHKNKFGEAFHAEVSGHEIPDIAEKNKRLILVRDITNDLRNQQEKEFQTYFLELIINNIPFPLYYKDDKGVYKGCNISFCNFLNKNKEEIIVGDYAKEHKQYVKSYQAPIEGEESQSILYLPLIHQDKVIGVITTQSFNKNAYSAYHLNLLRNLATYAAIAIDNASAYRQLNATLSELQNMQQQLVQQEKLASLGQLTAGIAHEIKNPLNFVNNFSELSVELIEEAREEVRRGTEDRASGS